MSDKSFAFIKADFDTLIDAIESQLGWLTTKEGDSQRQLVAKLKGSSNEVISFVSLTPEDIELSTQALDFRYDNELADEDLYHCVTIKEKLLEE
jgi:hypothetical protein